MKNRIEVFCGAHSGHYWWWMDGAKVAIPGWMRRAPVCLSTGTLSAPSLPTSLSSPRCSLP